MAQFDNLIDQFNEAIAKVADVWRTQYSGFNDKKIEEFGVAVLRPLSNAGQQLNNYARELDYSLNALIDKGLIHDK